MELRALDSRAPLWLRNWRGDGILTRTGTPAIARAVRRAGVPMVELRSPRLNPGVPWVGVDNRAMGKLVADHLIQRGFRHFGAYELASEIFFEERRGNFIATLAEAGYTCASYQPKGRPEKPAQWERHQEDLARWVEQLPKPVGIMACTDQLGFFLLDACARVGVRVPDEVAVVGVENEESLCTMAVPALSSVEFNLERIGYEAAATLERLMAGQRPLEDPLLIEPLGVVVRGSSDVVAVGDSAVAEAARFIREHACEGIAVGDVLKRVPISRSALERRMRAALGRTPNEEINRVRVETVKRLLVGTDLPLAAIAERTGFAGAQYLVDVFRRKTGQTPGAFRRRHGKTVDGGT